MNPRTTRRIALWAVLGAALLVALYFILAPQPVEVDLATIHRGDVVVTLDHEGKTRVRDRFVVSAPLSGRVLRIELEPGDPVVAGKTVLASFRPSEPVALDARSRAEAEAAVAAARAALEQARAQRDQARAEHAYALREAERNRSLAAEGVVSAEQLDQAEATAEARTEALAAAEAAVRSASHDLERAGAALLEPGAPDAAGRTVLELRSPVDGVVLRRDRESESVVAAGEPLIEVADPADLEIVADFLSTDAVRIRPGMPARIERWGGDHELEARVRRVEPSGFMKVSALGVEEQRVNVILDFAEAADPAALGDEYRVEVAVIVADRHDVTSVPTGALFRRNGDWAVFVVDGGRARLRMLKLGARGEQVAEVLDGLADGDTVILHPGNDVADGGRVAARTRS